MVWVRAGEEGLHRPGRPPELLPPSDLRGVAALSLVVSHPLLAGLDSDSRFSWPKAWSAEAGRQQGASRGSCQTQPVEGAGGRLEQVGGRPLDSFRVRVLCMVVGREGGMCWEWDHIPLPRGLEATRPPRVTRDQADHLKGPLESAEGPRAREWEQGLALLPEHWAGCRLTVGWHSAGQPRARPREGASLCLCLLLSSRFSSPSGSV